MERCSVVWSHLFWTNNILLFLLLGQLFSWMNKWSCLVPLEKHIYFMFPNCCCLLCEPLAIWWLQPWQFWSPVPGSGSSFVIQLWAKRIALVRRKWWIWGRQIWSNASSPVKRGGRKAKPGPHLVSSILANESAVDDGLLSPACPVRTSLLQPEPAQVRL